MEELKQSRVSFESSKCPESLTGEHVPGPEKKAYDEQFDDGTQAIQLYCAKCGAFMETVGFV